MTPERVWSCGGRTVAMRVIAVMMVTVASGAVRTVRGEGADTRRVAVKQPAMCDDAAVQTSRVSPVRLRLPAAEEAFSFVVFGDRTGGPADGVRVLEQAVKDVNLLAPDMVMTIGDMVQGYCDTEPWLAQVREYKGIMDQLRCPWFPTPGNHDLYCRDTAARETEYEAHFGPLWYSFAHKGCRFVVLCADEGDPATGRKGFGSPATQRMSAAQYDWLKTTLAAAKDARHVFIFQHHPRWLGNTPHGDYGDDWERVHGLLAATGNVRTVFCGHWHRMRHDGVRDGIEYVQMASVGGYQEGHSPEGGWLHQFHVVTVRGNDISMAALPVGQVMDVRRITRALSEDTELLGNERPRWRGTAVLHLPDNGEGTDISFAFRNPTSRPVELKLRIASEDTRWTVRPDRVAVTLDPGAEQTFEFNVRHPDAGRPDASMRMPELLFAADYLADAWRVPMRELRLPLPLEVKLPEAAAAQAADGVIEFDGDGDYIEVESAKVALPDGPFTLEAWFRPKAFNDRMALAAKSQNSDYGMFINGGKPHFAVFLGDGYVSAASGTPLRPGAWHHIAGVYDGQEVRLYVDGGLTGRQTGSGRRRPNNLGLLIGADPDRSGAGTSFFNGRIDVVRLSKAALYAGESCEPPRKLQPGADTVMLLNFDRAYGPFHPDDSGREAHGIAHGDPSLEPLSER